MIPRPRNIVKQLCLVIMALLMGCTGSGDRKGAADGNSRHLGFSQTKGMADSLYSTMQFASGFGRSSYFSGRFRLHYGMSPSDFRTSAASALSEI